jgi:spermidine/putrescine transport system ATP-binding protein
VQLAAVEADVPAGANRLVGGVVTDASFIGVSTQYLVKLPSGEELAVFEQNTGREIQRPGSQVVVHWDPSQGFGLDGSQDIEAGAEPDEESAA